VKEILKEKFRRSATVKKPATEQVSGDSPNKSSGKDMRNWVKISEKVSAKDMDKIDQSLHKGGEIDIDR
jgi:hypothetical protein